MDTLQTSPVDATQIRTSTNNDPLLARVRDMILKGWRNTSEEDLKPYQHCQNELTVHAGCILLGNHVAIPSAGCQKVLKQAFRHYKNERTG